jgi:hypothetical protein
MLDIDGVCRNEDPTPAPFVRKHLGGEGAPEKTLLYPAKGSYNTTAIYDGLVATLPAVSITEIRVCRADRMAGLDGIPGSDLS